MIPVTPNLAIAMADIELSFIRSPGPGGQNVNKVETAVQLRFDALACPTLPAAIIPRLRTLAGRRMTAAGVIILTARRHRSQERNRADAIDRLVALIRDAATVPKKRRPTRPSRAAKARRMDAKKRTGTLKKQRQRATRDD